MTSEEIIQFLKTEIEPLDDFFFGKGYRASVTLKDGTFLPAVTFRNPDKATDIAIKRLEEEKSGKGRIKYSDNRDSFREMVKLFVAKGNRINHYDIDTVQKSPFAFSKQTLSKIQGETRMGWTGFIVKMNDGKLFSFGTSYLFHFFQLPEGYDQTDILDIVNHSYVLTSGEIKSYRDSNEDQMKELKSIKIFRERPYFECYLDNL